MSNFYNEGQSSPTPDIITGLNNPSYSKKIHGETITEAVDGLLEKAEIQSEKNEKTEKRIEEILKDISDTRNLIAFGFIVLLVMVAAMVIQSAAEKTSADNNLRNTIELLQIQLLNQKNK